jgi:hypothetical protein
LLPWFSCEEAGLRFVALRRFFYQLLIMRKTL